MFADLFRAESDLDLARLRKVEAFCTPEVEFDSCFDPGPPGFGYGPDTPRYFLGPPGLLDSLNYPRFDYWLGVVVPDKYESSDCWVPALVAEPAYTDPLRLQNINFYPFP